MARQPHHPLQHSTKPAPKSRTIDPSELGIYLNNPSIHPNVVDFDEYFVIIKDKYPKATVHLLILPRDSNKSRQHPFTGFRDNEFLNSCKKEASKWRVHASQMLKEVICPNQDCPRDYDWESNILIGVHTEPYMQHLHIHITRRRCPCKHGLAGTLMHNFLN